MLYVYVISFWLFGPFLLLLLWSISVAAPSSPSLSFDQYCPYSSEALHYHWYRHVNGAAVTVKKILHKATCMKQTPKIYLGPRGECQYHNSNLAPEHRQPSRWVDFNYSYFRQIIDTIHTQHRERSAGFPFHMGMTLRVRILKRDTVRVFIWFLVKHSITKSL